MSVPLLRNPPFSERFMAHPAIVVDNLSKSYRIDHLGRQLSFREAFAGALRAPFQRDASDAPPRHETFWALKDVSFSIRPGEVLGILGRNGAGKSTLLKILSRITEPTSGLARIRGRLASLLEVGTGFHPELTGRENVYLNGSILGMKKAEIDRRFDEIVAFAEVERFLDTQIKHYSSGMVVRLAFAVAAQLDSQILIVDEVLAVGDLAFQKKCLGRLDEVTRQGRTVLFVSHNVPAMQNLCSRCILLERGKLVMDGEPTEVLEVYNRTMGGASSASQDLSTHAGRPSNFKPLMQRVSVSVPSSDRDYIRIGDPVRLEVEFDSTQPMGDVFCRAFVKNNLGMPLFGLDSDVERRVIPTTTFQSGLLRCQIDHLPLMPGSYAVDLYFGSRTMVSDIVHDACRFEVHAADYFGTGRLPDAASGNMAVRGNWEFVPAESASPSCEASRARV
ncbi:MAG: ABC transporter ATP-binding protein [Isosphaeraceae bacterium]